MRPNWFVKQPWLSNVELQCGGGGNSEEVREELTSEVVQKKWHTVVSCLITNDRRGEIARFLKKSAENLCMFLSEYAQLNFKIYYQHSLQHNPLFCCIFQQLLLGIKTNILNFPFFSYQFVSSKTH